MSTFAFSERPGCERFDVKMSLGEISPHITRTTAGEGKVSRTEYAGITETTMTQLTARTSELVENAKSTTEAVSRSARVDLALVKEVLSIGGNSSYSMTKMSLDRKVTTNENVTVSMSQNTTNKWMQMSWEETLKPGQSLYAYQWSVALPGGRQMPTVKYFISNAQVVDPLPSVIVAVYIPAKPIVLRSDGLISKPGTFGDEDNFSIKLRWTPTVAHPAVTGYDIQQKGKGAADSSASTLGQRFRPLRCSLTVGGLQPGTTYEFRARMKSTAGEGEWGPWQSLCTKNVEYVSGIGREWARGSAPRVGCLREIDGCSDDINNGHGGKYVYLYQITTSKRSEAIVGLRFHISNTEAGNVPALKNLGFGADLAKGAGGQFRQLAPVRDPEKTPVLRGSLGLWRSSNSPSATDLANRGFVALMPICAEMGGVDLNDKRGGKYLLIVRRK
jgi:hypothetical protein